MSSSGGLRKIKKTTTTKTSSRKGGDESERQEETTTTTTTTTSSTSGDHETNFGEKTSKMGSREVSFKSDLVNEEEDFIEEKMFCQHCDDSLAGCRYVLKEDQPFCIKCYESVHANNCDKCSKVIGVDFKDLSYKDKHWHEECFACYKCGASLVDKQFGTKSDRIYCGDCYDNQFAARCDGCNDVFRAGMKKMEYKTRQWHEKCFICTKCRNTIGTSSFIPKEHDIYCVSCYEDKYATKCTKCCKVISQGGVTYRNEPWHRECFTCTNCDNCIAGQRFTSREEKPYCAECFGELFSKRCTACHKAITGKGGLGTTKYVSFEKQAWHNECFFCADCSVSMVGKGFIQEKNCIVCPDCARERMMTQIETEVA